MKKKNLKNVIIITLMLIVIIIILTTTLICTTYFLPLSISYNKNPNLMTTSELLQYQILVAIYRILVYLLAPYLAYIIKSKTLILSKEMLSFYDCLFKLVAFFTALYILGAFDIKYGFVIFDNSQIYLSIIGILFIRVKRENN